MIKNENAVNQHKQLNSKPSGDSKQKPLKNPKSKPSQNQKLESSQNTKPRQNAARYKQSKQHKQSKQYKKSKNQNAHGSNKGAKSMKNPANPRRVSPARRSPPNGNRSPRSPTQKQIAKFKRKYLKIQRSIKDRIQSIIRDLDIKKFVLVHIIPYAIIFMMVFFIAEETGILPYPSILIATVGMLAGIGMLYVKRLDKKKFRHGIEHGSAVWGTKKNIEPFMDSNHLNNIILTNTEGLTMNSRPSNPEYARNKNILVIGGSGSGKTRFFAKPNLMQCESTTYPVSFVCTDPKGTIVLECGKLLQDKGYNIKILNTIDFDKSMHYNPLLCY